MTAGGGSTRGAGLIGRALFAVCGLLVARPLPAADRAPTVAPFAVEATAIDSIAYRVIVTDNNLMGVTVSNYGFVGNNFISRSPSMEYPLGTGFEHMVRGGIWIGARAVDDSGAFIGVATSAVDGSQGTSAQAATEYTPASRDILIRSTLINDTNFNLRAVSERDFLSEFSDRPARRALGNDEDHRPMSILVRQENYAWSFSDYQHFVIFHYVIKNLGPPLANLWVGFYGELASGSKRSYTSWPPSSTGNPLGGWYRKKLVVYDDSLRLFREHYCQAQPVPSGCNFPLVPYWVGIKLLGTAPDSVSNLQLTLAAWDYDPGNDDRDQDVERYALMSAGTIADLSAPHLQPPGDPVAVLAVGPFAPLPLFLATGDSIEVDFALIGGAEIVDLHDHSRFAQRAFDRDYIIPVPPPSPRFRVVARDRALDFYWDDSPEQATDPTSPIPQDFEGYRLYVGDERLDLRRVAQFDKDAPPNDTTGFNTGLASIRLATPVTLDGVTYHYKYTVPALRNGFKYFVAVTSYDLGNVEIESLESGVSQNKALAIPGPQPGELPDSRVTVFPNPYRVEARWDQGEKVRDHYLWFTNLPRRCTLRIFTLSGDQVFEVEFDGDTYRGEGARGVYDPRRELDVAAPTLSGSTFGWNLISDNEQVVASGLYLYSVEDGTGDRQVGKFLIVKSDREEF
ncbi:MAG TPA: hypothetical protein VEY91_04850 [Candidatus Limnocylindria bacterium]|nr:hypothetical protein [Candidatus Limnocylindria bacterium]